MWNWIARILVVGAILYWLDREVYFYEGARLGPRVQGWLYDRWAANYDRKKRESQEHDSERLARPIIEALVNNSNPYVLDYATGTGRMPLALLCESDFKGYVIGIDVSKGMLKQAKIKLAGYEGRFELVHLVHLPLPYPNNSFDVVSCMEALELMPNMEEPLTELFRVLKPGGVFMSSRGTEASGRKEKVFSVKELLKLLSEIGFEEIQITPWWKWFDHVLARKPSA